MNGSRILACFLFLVWATWCYAFAGYWSSSGSAWVPDIGLVLALSVMARAEVGDAPILALLATLARASFSPEPPIVLLAGFAAIVFLAITARSAVELTGPLWRTIAALVLVLVFNAWLAFARAVRDPSADVVHVGVLSAALPVAISSALLAFAAGPLFAHLPGLKPMRRRPW
ncbi:MAG: hypothetical protein JNL28_08935 [Planctomycetes bacterium]|nr:hypothetical protein [Planctomycetota bacterium]